MRRSPTRVNAKSLIAAINRLEEIRAVGIGNIDLSNLPQTRIKFLARNAAASRAVAISKMPDAKRIATLLAFTHELEYTATDDVIDLLNLFIRGLLAKSKREGEKERLRTLKNLDAAALRLVEAVEVMLDTDTEDIALRDKAYKRISEEQLIQSVARVKSLARPDTDEMLDTILSRWRYVRQMLPTMFSKIEFFGMENAAPIIEALDKTRQTLQAQLNEAYHRTCANFKDNASVRIEISDGKEQLVLTGLDKLALPPSLITLKIIVAAMLPRIDLPELLLEIDARTSFSSSFTHISQTGSRVKDLHVSICAILIAEACNIGLEPLIRPEVPALTRGRLSWVQQNYIRAETIIRANARLVDAQTCISTAQVWGGGEVASADGLRFSVPVRTINAAPNSKYFGVGKGVTY